MLFLFPKQSGSREIPTTALPRPSFLPSNFACVFVVLPIPLARRDSAFEAVLADKKL